MTLHVSVSEVFKLVTQFKGDRRKALAFSANVHTAFKVTNPRNMDMLRKFVLTRVSGEPRIAARRSHLECWEELKEFLKNTYIVTERQNIVLISCLDQSKGNPKMYRNGFKNSVRNFEKQLIMTAK